MGRFAEVGAGVAVESQIPEFSPPPRADRDPSSRGSQTVLDDGVTDHRRQAVQDRSFRDFAVQVPNYGMVDVSIAPHLIRQGTQALTADQVTQILAAQGGVVTLHQGNQIQVATNDQSRTPYMTLRSDNALALASIFHEIGTVWEKRFGKNPAFSASFHSTRDSVDPIDPVNELVKKLNSDGMLVIDPANRQAVVQKDPRIGHAPTTEFRSSRYHVTLPDNMVIHPYRYEFKCGDSESFGKLLGNLIGEGIQAYQPLDRY